MWITDTYRNLSRGFRNLWRWAPVIWSDYDWDWTQIAKVLEFKLRLHAALEEKHGHHLGSKLDAKRMRICADLLRRLQDDNYYSNAKKFFSGPVAAHAADRHHKEDQRYLGLLLGKYLTHWWD